MCVYEYTLYEKCGCRHAHATLPCPDAFNSETSTCNPSCVYKMEKVDAYCPDCKSAFDNKDLREFRLKLTFKRSTIPKTPCPSLGTGSVHPVSPQPGPSCERSNPLREGPLSPDQIQLKGTFAEIDQQHNQFRGLIQHERMENKHGAFLKWLDDPQHPAPAYEEHIKYGSTITPPPLPTPPTPMTETMSFRVNDKYVLKARRTRLSASQREAMARANCAHIRQLTIINRQHIHVRRHHFSASQREVMARAGFPNVRTLSVVRTRRTHQDSPSSDDDTI